VRLIVSFGRRATRHRSAVCLYLHVDKAPRFYGILYCMLEDSNFRNNYGLNSADNFKQFTVYDTQVSAIQY